MQQRTEEWRAARLGVLTGTRANAVLNSGKAAQNTLIAEVVAEVAVSFGKSFKPSSAILQGIRREPVAMAHYELRHNCKLIDGGFTVSTFHPLIAVSPDARVGINQGGVEVKCPEPTAHAKMLMTGEVDKAYEAQIDWALMIYGCEWWDLYSFNPDFPAHLCAFEKRYMANERDIDQKREKALDFAERVEQILKDLGLWMT